MVGKCMFASRVILAICMQLLCSHLLTVSATTQSTVSAFRGDELTILPCRSNDSTIDTVEWFKQDPVSVKPNRIFADGVIVNGYTVRFNVQAAHHGVFNLAIKAVMLSDSGTYMCAGDHGHGHLTVVQLRVFDAAATTPKWSFNVFVGDQVTLPCSVVKVDPGADWYFQAMRTSTVPRPVRIATSGAVENGHAARFEVDATGQLGQNLVVKRIRPDDAGVYTCVAEAGQGQRTSVRVGVFANRYPEDSVDVNATVGSAARLPCRISSNAVSSSWWYQKSPSAVMVQISKDGYVYSRFSESFGIMSVEDGVYDLTLTKASIGDVGEYVCLEDSGDGFGRRTRVRAAFYGVATQNTPHAGETSWSLPAWAKMLISVISVAVIVALAMFGLQLGLHHYRWQRRNIDDAANHSDAVRLSELECIQPNPQSVPGYFPKGLRDNTEHVSYRPSPQDNLLSNVNAPD